MNALTKLKSEKPKQNSREASAIAWLSEIPLRNASRIFLVDSIRAREFTFAQLHETSCALASWLKAQGLNKGDRAAIVLPNQAFTIQLYFGCLYAGITAVPINPVLSQKEVDFIVQDSGAKLVFVCESTKDKAKPGGQAILVTDGEKVPASNGFRILDIQTLPSADTAFKAFQGVIDSDELIVVYTSGTTAEPKGVIHRIRDLVQNGRLFGKLLGIGKKNRFFNNLALTYLGGYYNLMLLPYVCESSVVLADTFNPASVISFWQPIIKNQVNTLWLVASLMSILLEMDRGKDGEKYCCNKVTHVLAGMAPLPIAVRKKFEERYGVKVYENYGLSETLFISTNSPKAQIKDGCVGRLVPGVEVSIRDAEDRAVAFGEEGEIWVQTPYLMPGYIDSVKSPHKKILKPSDWFPTGDLGILNKSKDLFITGRKKDLIIRGGINISPASIENVLYQHPAVMECAVVGVPHKFLGEEVIAVVRIAESLNFDAVKNELLESCRQTLARIKQPSRIVELIEFPHTTSGKIQKRKIRAWLMQKTDESPHSLQGNAKSAGSEEVHFTPSRIVSESVEAMSIKYNTMVYEMQRKKIDVTVLSLGEAFFDIPLYKFDALPFPQIYHYSHSRGILELRQVIAKYFSTQYDVSFNPESEILITAGSKIAIHMALMAIINPGDEVMYYEPAWVSYPEQIKLCYGVPVSIPYDEKIENFEKYITNRTRILIINNPNNPTGRVFNLSELGHLYAMARRHNLFILSDEAYSEYVLNQGEFISFANLDIDKRHTIIVNSLSKNFGMSGWRLGYVITNPGLINQILKINQHLITCPPTILEYYAAKYFSDIIKTTLPQITAMVERRQEIQKFMDSIGLSYLAGTATFYFFVSIAPTKLSSEAFCDKLLERDHICVVPGIGYGKSCGQFVRVSVGSESPERIKTALKKLKRLIEETAK